MAEDFAWCAADPHFGRDDPALPVFFDWLKAFEKSGAESLCLMGDLFQVWIGLPHAQSPDQKAVAKELGRLAASGRPVVYLMGNRDYFVEETARSAGFLARETWDLPLEAGGAVRFEHGDLVNVSDDNYLRWREISRSSTVRAIFQSLPPGRQVAIAEAIERKFSGTNLRYKDYRPERELEAWARRLAGQGVRKVVLGHFHVDETLHVAGVEVRFLPQFREEGRFLRVTREARLVLESFAGPES
jgi:UDP-2,3-diacylglucosamine hydrolase